MAKIISFEGQDGLGKSTQVARVAKYLTDAGNAVKVVKLPQYSKLTGKIILRMLRSGLAARFPNAFQVIQWLDKYLFQLFTLSALLRNNDYVLFDRWHASMWAYGLASGASERLTNVLVSTLRDTDKTCVFYGTCKRQEANDAYESNKDMQRSVALHYILWTYLHNNVVTIDSDQPEQIITNYIIEHVL